MLVRVLENVASTGRFERVIAAVEDDELRDALRPYRVDVVVTGPAPNGTARVARVAPRERAVVNVQGDLPLVDDVVLGPLVEALGRADVVTAAAPWEGDRDDPARVKVWDGPGPGPDFGRTWAPGARRHVGIYGFAPGQVHRCAACPETPRAAAASLEQLAWLDGGVSVAVVAVPHAPASVDTPADLAEVRRRLGVVSATG